jgi:succinylglutamate desuccinylase
LVEGGEIEHVVNEANARLIFPNPSVAVGLQVALVIVPAMGYSR